MLAAAFIALLLVSCRKDKDLRPPVVEVLEPVAGTTIAIPDTILVRVRVNDDHQLTGLTIELLDEGGAVVATAGTITLEGSSGTYERSMVLMDERSRPVRTPSPPGPRMAPTTAAASGR